MYQVNKYVAIIACILLVTACGTTDSALRSQGYSDAYMQGFHDGRHSGMKEAGNNWEHYIKDHNRFTSDTQYQTGWIEGETEGKRLQSQAKGVGEAMGGAYSGYRVSKEAEKDKPHPQVIVDEVMKGVDTSDFSSLGK